MTVTMAVKKTYLVAIDQEDMQRLENEDPKFLRAIRKLRKETDSFSRPSSGKVHAPRSLEGSQTCKLCKGNFKVTASHSPYCADNPNRISKSRAKRKLLAAGKEN